MSGDATLLLNFGKKSEFYRYFGISRASVGIALQINNPFMFSRYHMQCSIYYTRYTWYWLSCIMWQGSVSWKNPGGASPPQIGTFSKVGGIGGNKFFHPKNDWYAPTWKQAKTTLCNYMFNQCYNEILVEKEPHDLMNYIWNLRLYIIGYRHLHWKTKPVR